MESEFTAEQIEWGRWLFAQSCTFFWGAKTLKDLPEFGPPEVCFAGRSNVGKSSIINALTGRTTLAKTSNTPGRTQQLNFFSLGGHRIDLVDMPGYGFAQASKKDIARWNEVIRQYLLGRPTLARVYLLIDSRHGFKEIDQETMKQLDTCAVSYRIILTKCDKIKDADRSHLIEKIENELKKHPAAFPYVLLTSSEKKEGIDLFRAEIAQFSRR